MVDAEKQQTVWSLQGNLAELNCGNLSGRIDTARPHAGLCDTSLDGPASVFLKVHRNRERGPSDWPLPLTDAYVRGNDLVATYGPASDWPFSPQLYWRANALQAIDGVLVSVSLLVSVQTHLLDTCPQIGVATEMPRGELLLVSVGPSGQRIVNSVNQSQTISAKGAALCIVTRFKDGPFSYAEIMPASDLHELLLRPDGERISCEWRLFTDFLEKGVIRRARVFAAMLTRKNDIELAAACCDAIEGLELPLTT